MELPPEGPPGYPPPTLIRRRSRVARPWTFVLLLIVAVVLGLYLVSRMTERPPAKVAASEQPAAAGTNADTGPADIPDAATPSIAVETASDTPTQPPPDARKPNRWYYVPVLGDGPGAIYSRSGGAWDFAFACTVRSHKVEILAVGTGDPGDFDKQAIDVGRVKLMMDAAYSKDAGGTISTTIPAAHPFLTALDGTAPMEIQLVAGRKSVVPVGPDLIRLIKVCRGQG